MRVLEFFVGAFHSPRVLRTVRELERIDVRVEDVRALFALGRYLHVYAHSRLKYTLSSRLRIHVDF